MLSVAVRTSSNTASLPEKVRAATCGTMLIV
jgi:hypothetical protein